MNLKLEIIVQIFRKILKLNKVIAGFIKVHFAETF